MDGSALRSEGWYQQEVDGFSGEVGPLWLRGAPGTREVGFLSEERHGNMHMGTIHGGALMTFADVALGYVVVEALGAPTCATVNLQLHFIAAGRVGDFVSCRPELLRRTKDLVFVRGLIASGDKMVASAEGLWKVIERKPRD